jgi:uncharacterized protein YjbI with pentapeptide repeats
MKVCLKFRDDAKVALAVDVPGDTPESQQTKVALELAVRQFTDLSALKLNGANLTNADLRHASLRGAYLNGANLKGAHLRRADLTHANLSGANLTGAELPGACLAYADLRGADLTRANLAGATLIDAKLAGAKLDGKKVGALVACIARIIDSYEFRGWLMSDGSIRIDAGVCRHGHSPDSYRQHVADKYPNTPKATETLAILNFIEARARAASQS